MLVHILILILSAETLQNSMLYVVSYIREFMFPPPSCPLPSITIFAFFNFLNTELNMDQPCKNKWRDIKPTLSHTDSLCKNIRWWWRYTELTPLHVFLCAFWLLKGESIFNKELTLYETESTPSLSVSSPCVLTRWICVQLQVEEVKEGKSGDGRSRSG